MKDSKTEQDAHETLVGAENGPARAEEAPLTLEDLDGIKKGLEDIEAIKEITDGGFSLCGLKGCECGLNADALLLGKVRKDIVLVLLMSPAYCLIGSVSSGVIPDSSRRGLPKIHHEAHGR